MSYDLYPALEKLKGYNTMVQSRYSLSPKLAWRLILWLRRVFGALLQVRIVKPTFGRPRYRFDVRHIRTYSIVWVEVDKAPQDTQE